MLPACFGFVRKEWKYAATHEGEEGRKAAETVSLSCAAGCVRIESAKRAACGRRICIGGGRDGAALLLFYPKGRVMQEVKR